MVGLSLWGESPGNLAVTQRNRCVSPRELELLELPAEKRKIEAGQLCSLSAVARLILSGSMFV